MKNHNDFFVNPDHQNDVVTAIIEYLSDDEPDRLEGEYTRRIADFIDNYPIVFQEKNKEVIQLLIYNYWYVIFVYRKHTTWLEDAYNRFFISSTRMIEFLIYLCHISDSELLRLFVDIPHDEILYDHFSKIQDKIGQQKFTIVHNPKHNEISLNGIRSYKSTTIIQPKGVDNERSDFAFFFKLQDDTVNKIYHFEESIGGLNRFNRRTGSWTRISFIKKEEYLNFLLPTDDSEKVIENKAELDARKKKLSTFDLRDPRLIYGDDNDENNLLADKINLSSSYKRFLVNKAIGQSIAKRNLTLKSTYAIPEIEILHMFFQNVICEESLASNLTILTLIFGIRTEKLIYAIAGLDSHIRLTESKSTLRVNKAGGRKIFAGYEVEEEIAKRADKKDVEILLPHVLMQVWQESEAMIKERYIAAIIRQRSNVSGSGISDSHLSIPKLYKKMLASLHTHEEKDKFQSIIPELVAQIERETQDYLKSEIKKFGKKISLKYDTLPQIFLHLFRTRKKQSDIQLLFTGAMSKNDEARVCYAAVPQRLVQYEGWQMEFMRLLGLDKILRDRYSTPVRKNSKEFHQRDEWVGSRLFIRGTSFQKFLLNLLSLKFENAIENVNARMIFFKYILSLEMAARDFKASLSLAQFSAREQVIFIQEKGKNLFSSKRIIPLTSNGVSLVNQFLEMQKQYQIHTFYPCLIETDSHGNTLEKTMNKSSIRRWLTERRSDANGDIVDEILKFVDSVPLNFGRHIFTSHAIQSSQIESQYIDAFLNHYKMGTEDQGIYNHFDNQEYFRQVREVMHYIERIYVPKWRLAW